MIKQGFKYRMNLSGGDRSVVDIKAAPGPIQRGQLVILNAGLAVPYTGGVIAANSILGVAEEDKGIFDPVVKVDVVSKAVFEVDAIGLVKTNLVDADLFTSFKHGAQPGSIDLDDPVGPFIVVDYNNATGKAWVTIAPSFKVVV